MTTEELNNAVNKFGIETVTALATALRSVGADNTGRLINSLRTELRDTGEGLEMMIIGNGYFDIVDKGRLPGKQPPLADIVAWTKSKGLPESLAFPIAKNIGKFGIKPRPVLKQVVESNEFKKNFKLIGEAYARDVTQEINNIIKETNIK
jgi:hypothetical protein